MSIMIALHNLYDLINALIESYSARHSIIKEKIEESIIQGYNRILTDIPTEDDRSHLFITYLNKRGIILEWLHDGLNVHTITGSKSSIDRNLYNLVRYQLCILSYNGGGIYHLPDNSSYSWVVYWISIITAMNRSKELMNTHIYLSSRDTITIRDKLFIFL